MIKNIETVKKFQDDLIKHVPVNIMENFIIFETLKNQAISMNKWVTNDIEDFDWKIKLARALNGKT